MLRYSQFTSTASDLAGPSNLGLRCPARDLLALAAGCLVGSCSMPLSSETLSRLSAYILPCSCSVHASVSLSAGHTVVGVDVICATALWAQLLSYRTISSSFLSSEPCLLAFLPPALL